MRLSRRRRRRRLIRLIRLRRAEGRGALLRARARTSSRAQLLRGHLRPAQSLLPYACDPRGTACCARQAARELRREGRGDTAARGPGAPCLAAKLAAGDGGGVRRARGRAVATSCPLAAQTPRARGGVRGKGEINARKKTRTTGKAAVHRGCPQSVRRRALGVLVRKIRVSNERSVFDVRESPPWYPRPSSSLRRPSDTGDRRYASLS